MLYPGASPLTNGTGGIFSLYLERNVFVAQPAALADGLAQLWANQNPGVLPGALVIQIQNQVPYICAGGYERKQKKHFKGKIFHECIVI